MTTSSLRPIGAHVRTAVKLLLPILWSPLVLLAALLFTACGGGSNAPVGTAPSFTSFGAAATTHFVGDRAQLTAVFAGGSGRIVSNSGAVIGPVTSGVAVTTEPLAASTRFTLVVEGGGATARRELTVNVGYRDRYVTVPGERLL